jgi:predicted nucleic acid-binding protein
VILVDTSVWVSAFRSAGGENARVLRALLDDDEVALAAPARVELLIGLRGRDQAAMRQALSALPVIYPTQPNWQTIDNWVEIASRVGERFGFADLLIGAIASDNRLPIWSLDQDFSRMAKLGWLKLFDRDKR